jgi:hypothetical protein
VSTSFEIYQASVPRHLLTGWRQPLALLEQLSCYQVYDVALFLDEHGIDYAMGWYGDPDTTYEDVRFRLLLSIKDAASATVFRLWSGIEEFVE